MIYATVNSGLLKGVIALLSISPWDQSAFPLHGETVYAQYRRWQTAAVPDVCFLDSRIFRNILLPVLNAPCKWARDAGSERLGMLRCVHYAVC